MSNLSARTAIKDQFISSLINDGPAAELGDAAATYGWLVGSWDVHVIDYDDIGKKREQLGEWHFAWVLEGRAIQDVFIVPRREARDSTVKQGDRYGSTLRMYDAAADSWRISWRNPVTGARDELVGKKIGNEIVQEGIDDNGNKFRWIFDNITTDSFHWFGERSYDGGVSWKFEVEFFATRSK
jgi:hypothetical protein